MTDETRRYTVDTVRDDPVSLRNRLDAIADEGGRVISIMWQPGRVSMIDGESVSYESGYTVVSENE